MGEIDTTTRDNETKAQKLARQRILHDALWASVPKKPPIEELAAVSELKPTFNVAIKKAENDPDNFGVLSEQVNSPKQANKALNESISNSYLRWVKAGKPGRFVDFMQARWAPIDAPNDPKDLNMNWSNNVRAYLLKLLGAQKYNQWRRMRLAKAGDSDAVSV